MRIDNIGFIPDKDEYEPGEQVRVIYNAIATDESNTFTANADDMKIEYEGNVAVITFTMPAHDVDLKCVSNSMWPPSAAPGSDTPLGSFQNLKLFTPVEQQPDDPKL